MGVLEAAEGYLRQRGVEAPRLSIEWMLARVLGLSRVGVYMAHDRPLGEAEKQQLRTMVARRGKGEPLAYIFGDQDFCGFDLQVNEAVLIPRSETEGLVELARLAVPADAQGIDIGTGSGAIAIALCKLRPDLRMLATDVSESALVVARANAEALDVAERIEFLCGDYWQAVGDREPLDFLISNPPYVDPSRPELVAADVAAFEPDLALYTPPEDPGQAYRMMVEGLPGRLRPGGLVFFETGVAADQAALAVMQSADCLDEVELRLDESDLPRYLLGRYRGP